MALIAKNLDRDLELRIAQKAVVFLHLIDNLYKMSKYINKIKASQLNHQEFQMSHRHIQKITTQPETIHGKVASIKSTLWNIASKMRLLKALEVETKVSAQAQIDSLHLYRIIKSFHSKTMRHKHQVLESKGLKVKIYPPQIQATSKLSLNQNISIHRLRPRDYLIVCLAYMTRFTLAKSSWYLLSKTNLIEPYLVNTSSATLNRSIQICIKPIQFRIRNRIQPRNSPKVCPKRGNSFRSKVYLRNSDCLRILTSAHNQVHRVRIQLLVIKAPDVIN